MRTPEYVADTGLLLDGSLTPDQAADAARSWLAAEYGYTAWDLHDTDVRVSRAWWCDNDLHTDPAYEQHHPAPAFVQEQHPDATLVVVAHFPNPPTNEGPA